MGGSVRREREAQDDARQEEVGQAAARHEDARNEDARNEDGHDGRHDDASGPALVAEDEARWLDADEQRAWRTFVEGVQAFWAAEARDHEHRLGMSAAEYEVLVRLSEVPDRTRRMSELADELGHSRSRLTHTVRRMEDAGWVARCAATGDGRGVNCTMTELGWRTLVAAAPTHVDIVRRRLVDVLTRDELLELGRILGKVDAALRPCPSAPATSTPAP